MPREANGGRSVADFETARVVWPKKAQNRGRVHALDGVSP